jgi:thymidylate synthase (FAD)
MYYESLLEQGVCREQARAILPQSLLTKFYMTGNLRNWVHFIRLRKDNHAQYEVQVVARRIEQALRKLWPNSMEALLPNDSVST